MATVSYIPEHKQTSGAMKAVMDYCMQEKKTVEPETGIRFVSGVNCIGANSFTEFLATKAAHQKMDGMQFYQYVQSFSPKEKISHAQAHEIALEFAAKAWPGHEVLVCTHCDAAHIHSHFIINSVSMENGKKLRQNPNTLKELRKLSDEICSARGFSIVPPKERKTSEMSSREYHSAERGESWKLQLEIVIDRAMESAREREHFIRLMGWEGYAVRWSDDRKYITYTTPDGFKCRDKKLHEDKYRKENMEYEFRIRKEIIEGNEGSPERNAGSGEAGTTRRGVDGCQLEGTDFFPGGSDQCAGTASGHGIYTCRPTGSGGLGEPGAGVFPERNNGTGEGLGAAPEGADRIIGQADGASGIGGDGDRETGWEYAREIFLRNLTGADAASQSAEEAVLDFSDSQFDFGDLGVDAAYLAADLSGIIEDEDVEDCTTMRPVHEHKRKTGPAMGGM